MAEMEDKRIALMVQWIRSYKEDVTTTSDLLPLISEQHELLEELLADRKSFRYLFIWHPGNNFVLDVDGLSQFKSPLDLEVFYFVRRCNGFIPIPQSDRDPHFFSRIAFKTLLRDPILELTLPSDLDQANAEPYVSSKLAEFATVVKNYSAGGEHEDAVLKFSRKHFIYSVPFEASGEHLSPPDVEHLKWRLSEWSTKLQDILDSLGEVHFPQDDVHAIPSEYDWWRSRADTLARVKKNIHLPAVQRSVKLLANLEETLCSDFISKCALVSERLEEAMDNMKFLSGIKRQVEVCTNATEIPTIQAMIPKVIKSLRSAWTLSKHYNSDKNMIGLLGKVTFILLLRVRNFVQLEMLPEPQELLSKVRGSLQLLTDWEKAFHQTRLAIEESGREARWEFSVKDIFQPAKHSKQICRDVITIAERVQGVFFCFSKALAEATLAQEEIEEVKKTMGDLVASYSSLQYDVFSESNLHHWDYHLGWFQRGVRMLEVKAVGLCEKIFDELVSAKAAVTAVTDMMEVPERNDNICRTMLNKVPKIMRQFLSELNERWREFDANCQHPPIADHLPPISGSIYWAREISERLSDTMSAMQKLSSCQTDDWKQVVETYESFQEKLEEYTERQYQEWCARVSDILEQNLTRPLLRVVEGSDSLPRYSVNFTSDLSDALAEVKHLETLGFGVPDVARNMSVQKTRLINLAKDLEVMIAEYHECVDSLEPAETQLLQREARNVSNALFAGHSRLTWNHQAIHDTCLTLGRRKIAIFKYKIQQVHIVKESLVSAVEAVRKACIIRTDKLPKEPLAFNSYHRLVYDGLKKEFGLILSTTESMTPCLLKIEEFLFGTRSLRSQHMAKYYAYWEDQLYSAVVEMTIRNLNLYHQLLGTEDSHSVIRVQLQGNEIALEPDGASIIEGSLLIIKGIIESSKKFVRKYKSSWIPCAPVKNKDSLHYLVISFYDDMVRLKSIKDAVESIQNSLLEIMRTIQSYLMSWRRFRNLWLYSKEQTCQKFIRGSPSCVDFDEKLLFYYNTYRLLLAKTNSQNFKSICLDLSPLKNEILRHVDEWIATLGKLLEQTAQECLKTVSEKVDGFTRQLKPVVSLPDVNEALTVISSVERISLEVEIAYNDVEERCRTMEMYAIKGSREIMAPAKLFLQKWNELYAGAKETDFRLRAIKARLLEELDLGVKSYLRRVKALLHAFKAGGPGGKDLPLEQSFCSLRYFEQRVNSMAEEAEALNGRQQLLKQPITFFHTLKTLQEDICSNSKILDIFQEFEEALDVLSKTPVSSFCFQNLMEINAQVLELKASYGQHVMLIKLEKKLFNSLCCLEEMSRLSKADLSQRHWDLLAKLVNIDSEKLGPFLGLDFAKMKGTVQKIIEDVQKEEEVEEKLRAISSKWLDTKFSFHKWTSPGDARLSLLTLTNSSDFLTDLEYDRDDLKDMLKSPNSAFCHQRLKQEKDELTEVQQILSSWISTQEDCLLLARVILREEENQERFEEDVKGYARVMNEVVKKPTLRTNCLSGERQKELVHFSKCFDDHLRKCINMVNKAKGSLPRMRFLNFRETLVLLGGWKHNEHRFQQVAAKLFGDKITALQLGQDQVKGLVNAGEEVLEFSRPVPYSDNVEQLFRDLFREMRASLRKIIHAALRKCPSFFGAKQEAFFEGPEQVAYLLHDAAWNKDVTDALEHKRPSQGFKKCYLTLVQFIQDLNLDECKTTRMKERAANLLVLSNHKLETIYQFLKDDLAHTDDFLWKSTLRTEWDSEEDTIFVKQGPASLPYRYEFQAVDTLALPGPSKSQQFTMMNAIVQNVPIFLYGPVCSGKKTVLEDLIRRLGKQSTRLTLQKSESLESIKLHFQSVCESDFCCIMDGADEIPFHVMSASAPLFEAIRQAKEMRIRRADLMGTKINLNLESVMVFMSRKEPSHLHQDVPLSFLNQFRTVSISAPAISTLLSGKVAKFSRSDKAVAKKAADALAFACALMPNLSISQVSLANRVAKVCQEQSLTDGVLQVTRELLSDGERQMLCEFLQTDVPEAATQQSRLPDQRDWHLILYRESFSATTAAYARAGESTVLSLPSYSFAELFGQVNGLGEHGGGIVAELMRVSRKRHPAVVLVDGWPSSQQMETALCNLKDSDCNQASLVFFSFEQKHREASRLRSKLTISRTTEETMELLPEKTILKTMKDLWRGESKIPFGRNLEQRQRQFQDLVSLMKEVDDKVLVYCFCWSFGADWLDLHEETSLEAKLTSTLQLPRLLRRHHVDSVTKQWVKARDAGSELKDLSVLLVKHNKPIVFAGTGFQQLVVAEVARSVADELDLELHSPKDIREWLVTHLKAEDEEDLVPVQDHGGLLLVFPDLSRLRREDVSLVRDISMGHHIFRACDGFKPKRVKRVNVIGGISKAAYLEFLKPSELDLFARFHVFSLVEPRPENYLGFWGDQDSARLETSVKLLREVQEGFDSTLNPDVFALGLGRKESMASMLKCRNFSDWHENLISAMYFPLYIQDSRQKMKETLGKNSVVVSQFSAFPEEPASCTFEEVVLLTLYCLQYSLRSRFTFVGPPGVGKSSVIRETASRLDRKVVTHEEKATSADDIVLVDLTEMNIGVEVAKDYASGRTVFFVVPLLHQVEQAELIHILYDSTLVIGVPEWTEKDLLAICNNFSVTESMQEPLINIHMFMTAQSAAIKCHKPTISLFSRCCRLAVSCSSEAQTKWRNEVCLFQTLLKAIDDYKNHIASLEVQRDENDRRIREKCLEYRGVSLNLMQRSCDLESEQRTLEASMEEEESQLEEHLMSIADIKEQMSSLEADTTGMKSKSCQKLEQAWKEIERLTQDETPSERLGQTVKVMLNCLNELVVPTRPQPNSDDDFFKSKEFLDRLREDVDLLHPILTFLKDKMAELELHQSENSDDLNSAFIHYIHALLDMHGSKDEMSELEARMQECQLQLSQLEGLAQDIEDRKKEQSKITQEKQEAQNKVRSDLEGLRGEKKQLEKKINETKMILSAFLPHYSAWAEELQEFMDAQDSILAREVLKAASSCYLAILPQDQRLLGLGNIERQLSISAPVGEDMANAWTPWCADNLLLNNGLKNLGHICLIYDPHVFARDLLESHHNVLVFYVLTSHDLRSLRTKLSSDAEGAHVIVPNMDLKFLPELKAMRRNIKASVYVLVSEMTATPSDVFVLDFSLPAMDLPKVLHVLLNTSKARLSEEQCRRQTIMSQLDQARRQLYDSVLNLKPGDSIDRESVIALTEKIQHLLEESQPLLSDIVEREEKEFAIPAALLCAAGTLGKVSIRNFIAYVRQNNPEYCYLALAFQHLEERLPEFKLFILLHYEVLTGTTSSQDGDSVISFFLSSAKDGKVEEEEVIGSESRPDWCAREVWNKLLKTKVRGETLAAQMLAQEEFWSRWVGTTDYESPKLDSWSQLLIAIGINRAVQDQLIGDFLGNKWPLCLSWSTDVINLHKVRNFTKSRQPIALVDSRGCEDPSQAITGRSKVHVFAAGSSRSHDQWEKIITSAAIKGQWVVIQNFELDDLLILFCLKFLDSISNLHEDFRLWLTTQADWDRVSLLKGFHQCYVIRKGEARVFEFEVSTDTNHFPGVLIPFLKTLHLNLTEMRIKKALHWNASSHLPEFTIYRRISAHAQSMVPILYDRKILHPSEHRQILSWLLIWVYFPHVDFPCDRDQIKTDLSETLHVITEFTRRAAGAGTQEEVRRATKHLRRVHRIDAGKSR